MLRRVGFIALFLVSIALGGTVLAAPAETTSSTVDLSQLLQLTAPDSCATIDPLISTDELAPNGAPAAFPTACQLVLNCCRSGNANCCAVVSSVCR